jgi:hypothetical protein
MYRVLSVFVCLGALLAGATTASAQYRPTGLSDPATGESYRIEFGADLWSPTPNMVISSEGFGIIGTEIDLVQDLGLVKQRFGELRLVLRPATKHKFRFQYLPIKYQAETVLQRRIVFNGIGYNIGLPVNSQLIWKTYRFGYEYDFLHRDRWFAGFILEAKYTDTEATLESPVASEFARARGPIPAIGGIFRGYVVPNVSITAEVTGFKLPERVAEDYRGKYVDYDFYATVNFTNNVGVQGGFRSIEIDYTANQDFGDLKLRGVYFGAVVRY